ncbi:MAG TPA: zinc ribbon domain-containing protein [Thermoplasmata archaeon]|nr:zinc ribbon domain-containing protein [Thermoplasmata archaeon]
MATSVTCPRCGAANNPGTMFCVNCGSALSAGAGGAPAAAAPMYPPAMPGLPSAWDAERRKQVDRTKTGLLLLLIGGLISWIPLIGIVGFLLLLIGAILVILGRKAFGSTHARNVVLAIVLYFVGIIIGIIAGVLFAAALFSAVASQNPAAVASALASAFNTLLVGAIIAAAVSGIASVLFTYALQKQIGKMLLWAGYAANLVISIAVFAIIGPLISNAVAQSTSGGTYDPAPIVALQGQLSALGYLSVVPALLFAAATYLAWSRVSHGEIPPPTTPPGMPMSTMPPPR